MKDEVNPAFRAVAVVLAILVVLRVLRALPRAIGAIGAGAIGAILVLVAWLLLSSGTALEPSAANPPIRSPGDVPLVENGVAAVLACGEKRRLAGAAMDYVPEPRTGSWSVQRRGECNLYYHHAPALEQRIARHQRARSIGTPSSSPPEAKPDPGMEPIPPSKTRLERKRAH